MVKRLALLVLLLGLSLAGLAAPQVRGPSYELDRATVALGEPLQLRITRAAGASGASLDRLDLSALQHDFEILERTLGRDSAQETLTLTLYARRTGRYTLPGLSGLSGRAPRVTVTEGSATVPRVQWKLSLDPPQPLLRQPTLFTLEACDDGTLLWKRPQLPSVEGLLLRPLNETEIITTRDGQRCTAHRWHWALLPTATGALSLPLPVLEAGKFGRRLRFAPPALDVNVQPLPAWLPAQAAIGQPDFVAEPLPAQAVLEQPLAWHLRVSGAYSVQALQDQLTLQLGEADARLGMNTYASQLEPQASLALLPQYRVTLFLVPRARGALALPVLQLPWYDPASGQLMQARLTAQRIEVIDPLRQRWLTVGAVLAAGVPVLLLVLWLVHALRWRWHRHALQRALVTAQTPDALRRCLLAFGTSPQPARALTLQDWQQRVQLQWTSSGLDELVGALDAACFSDVGDPQEKMKDLRPQVMAWARSFVPSSKTWPRNKA